MRILGVWRPLFLRMRPACALAQLWYYARMTRSRVTFVLIAGVSLLLIVLLGGPALIRALPGRYAYYLPEPLQALRHDPHPELLPTPDVAVAPSTITPLPAATPLPTATPLPPASDTPVPSPSPTAPPVTPTGTSTPIPPFVPPISVTLSGLRHEHQGWNNCGPTTLAMALSYCGRPETQYDVAPLLKPDPEDKNVSLWEMETYARSLGLGALVRVNGSLDLLKELVGSEFPVIVETWYVRDASDQLGHYRLIIGYDDAASQFITYDSLHGPDLPIGYQELDELWRVFNRGYLVVYDPDRWEQLAAILGADVDTATMYQRALERAQAEVVAPPATCVAYADCADWVTFSWFNVGTSLTSLGRHTEAAPAYDQARQLGLHFRMLWYQFGPYESYYAVGRYQDVIVLADATLATTDNLEESYYWRGMARWALGDLDGAREDLEAALQYHEGWAPAVAALERLGQ